MNLLSSLRVVGARLSLASLLALGCLLGAAPNAHAGCGMLNGAKGPAVKLPTLPEQENEPFFANTSIVGLWKATYTATGGAIFNESLKTWHADGLEFESAYLSPEGGNVCTGVWKYTDFRTVKLHHLGWLYFAPNSVATNYFTVDEVVTVAPNGKTYTGTFDFKIWNLDGTPFIPPSAPGQVETKGTIAATRITA